MVDNRRERDHIPTVNTDWWNYGGITRPVMLIEVTTTYLADYFIQYQSENTILGWVKLDGDLTTNIEDVTVRLPELNLSTQMKINQEGYGEFKFQAEPILWSPATPKLYELILTYRDCQVVDQVGFRTIAVQGDNIYLNEESIFLLYISARH